MWRPIAMMRVAPSISAAAPSLLATKKERSGLQSACDELIDKGAIHHIE
jgi:hypothetical protein